MELLRSLPLWCVVECTIPHVTQSTEAASQLGLVGRRIIAWPRMHDPAADEAEDDDASGH